MRQGIVFLFLSTLLLYSGSVSSSEVPTPALPQGESQVSVILLIGDGMGFNHIEIGRLVEYVNGEIETAALPTQPDMPSNEDWPGEDHEQPENGPKRTKACLMPWNYMHVMWNGEIPPCCIVKDQFIGKCEDVSLTEIFNSDKMKQFRMGLLTGNVPDVCETCTYMPDGNTHSLSATVENYLGQMAEITLKSENDTVEPVTL